jgi:NitT/TauT family transport system substrate-binding protein
VKGKLPASIDAMLRSVGLVEGENFQTVLVEGFDPIAHLELPIDALPGWKSNEVGALARAGIDVDLFDPIDFGVPGSFGVIFSSADFVEVNPTAAQDFVRATMRGLADAVADPEAAANIAVEKINAGGNPNFLSPEGEVFRWATEAALISDANPADTGLATPDLALLQDEIEAYAEVGLFGGDSTPDAAAYLADDAMTGVYDASGALIWPS